MDIIGFALAVLLIELTPGPNMAWLAGLAATEGRRCGLAAVAGVALIWRSRVGMVVAQIILLWTGPTANRQLLSALLSLRSFASRTSHCKIDGRRFGRDQPKVGCPASGPLSSLFYTLGSRWRFSRSFFEIW